MPDLAAALYGNPLVPTPHWEPRCELCRLRRSYPEVYGWLTRVLLGVGDESLIQAQIAEEVTKRTGERVNQSQVSHHKVHHLDPSLRDAVESMTGHLVLLDFCASMEPADMAVAYVKLALVKTGQLLAEAEGAKSAAPLAAATAALAGVLQRAGKAEADTALAEVEAQMAGLRAQVERGDYSEQFASWVRANYPDLEPLLADPARIQAVVAQVASSAGGAP